MNKHNPVQQRVSKKPYEHIYVYNIQGEVSEELERGLGESYIGNWEEDDSSFLFFSENSEEIISELLKKDAGIILLDDYHFSYEEWRGGEVGIMRIGPVVITPPWRERDEKTGETGILLDPGVVFGTGLHPTTRDCLKALLHVRGISPFQRVLDIGTGTGILAISAAALGAREVLALDLNPLAVKTAWKNVKLNGFHGIIDVVHGKAENFIHHAADLITANIHYDVVKNLFEQEKFLKNDWFIVSGLMRTQASEFREVIKNRGLEIIREWDHEMTWYTFLLKYAVTAGLTVGQE